MLHFVSEACYTSRCEGLLKAFTREVKMRFEIVQGDEQLSSHSGLALAGVILDRSSIRKRLDVVVYVVSNSGTIWTSGLMDT